MADDAATLTGPDLAQGIPLASIEDGTMVLGHAHGEPVLLVRHGDEVSAIGPVCSHYGGPLDQGLVVGDTVRCPWHHACFSLRTGKPVRGPALNPVSRWHVDVVQDLAPPGSPPSPHSATVWVREKVESGERPSHLIADGLPSSIVIIGGGAAGNEAAETLRREDYPGRITMLSADAAPPVDRPNLSKGFLAGTASEDSNLLRPADFYKDHDIDLRLDARVTAIDTGAGQVVLANGSRHDYGALLLATGADPVRLDIPGGDLPHVRYLRTLADSRALVAAAKSARRVVVIGASFIGLEVAASLRAREVTVHVVAPEAVPMAKVLGPEAGAFVRKLHEEHGVTFHLGTTATAIDARGVTLKNGGKLEADLVVVGVGVRPALALAEAAGLALDRGVAVNEYLETSVPGIFAAGDIARWPDRLSGERIRVEHFVVAERQGQAAARNMLGRREPFDAVPFFWTDQYDVSIAYVGHAERWDQATIDGSLEDRNCAITYRLGGRKLAVATIFRDGDSLAAELEFERMAGLARS